MTRSLLSILFLCFLSYTSFSQEKPSAYAVKGIIIDSATNAPMEYVTIALKKSTGESIKTTLTKLDGSFLLEAVPKENYKIFISAVGYNTKVLDLKVDNSALDLGKILIISSSTTIKTTEIIADRPLIRQEVDRITYDIQADPDSKIKTVLDMMRKVPLLSVDGDDNIKMNGNSNYKILINGKPSSMIARSPKDVLRSMPASSIQRIEVITTPPSKYDSEGIAGLINIITTKKIDNGYNGSLSSRASFPVGGLGYGASINLKQGNFGLSGYGGISNYNNPGITSNSQRFTTNSLPTSLLQSAFNSNKNLNQYFGSELSYEIDTLNLISAEISSYFGRSNSEDQRFSSLTNQANSIIQGYQLNGDNRNEWHGLDATLNYQHGFKNKPNRLLTFSYSYNNGNDDYLNKLLLSDRVNYAVPNYYQINDGHSGEQTLQIDYIHPMKKLTIEGGVKAIQRDNDSDFESQFQNAGGDYIVDPKQANNFNNRQRILGAYNSYQYNLKDWGFKGGVRIEETLINADFISSSTQVRQDFFNIIPTLSINRKFKDMSSLNLGYTQRIQRPSIYNLNPFIDKTNPNFESTGNPDLIPVLSNNINLKYNKFKTGSFNIGLSYSFANNTVQEVSIFNAATNITRSTYLNIGKNQTLGTNISINYPLTKKWNANISGNINHLWIEGVVNGQTEKNSGFQGYVYGGMDYKFEKGLRVSANFNYNTPYRTLQGNSNSNIYSSFNVSKDIVKDKFSISAGTNNPFSKYRNNIYATSGVNFTQNSVNQNYYRSFSASLYYRFGKLKDAIKKNQRGINNDDVSGGKGN